MTQRKNKPSLLNADIRILVEATGVILVWRGVWSLADHYLFPDSPDVSALLSIGLGLLILFIENKNLKDLK